jgi:hypothetical protein
MCTDYSVVYNMTIMLIDPRELSAKFLTGTNLQNVVCHLCNQSAGLVSDPITETLTVMATTPVSVVITEAGVALFKNRPTMVLPYTSMTSEQLLYLRDVINTVAEDTITNDVKGRVQMGGGCIVTMSQQSNATDCLISQKDLLEAFVQGVYNSKDYNNWTKKALCGVIIQRLCCSTNISKETLRNSTMHTHALFPDKSPPPSPK